VLKPSEVLSPKSLTIASPINDHFYVRGTYFPAAVTTTLQPRSEPHGRGHDAEREEDLGLDDKVDQGRMEFDIRLRENNHVRIDYFKLNRFAQQPLPRRIVFRRLHLSGGHEFPQQARLAHLHAHVHVFIPAHRAFRRRRRPRHPPHRAHAEGGEPGTLNREKADEGGIFPTIAATLAYRISKRWAITLRGQQFSASPEDFKGKMADYHGDLQYRVEEELRHRHRLQQDPDEPGGLRRRPAAVVRPRHFRSRDLLPGQLLAFQEVDDPLNRRRVAQRAAVPEAARAPEDRSRNRLRHRGSLRHRRHVVVFVVNHEHRDAHAGAAAITEMALAGRPNFARNRARSCASAGGFEA
jgi:hypothetical protein